MRPQLPSFQSGSGRFVTRLFVISGDDSTAGTRIQPFEPYEYSKRDSRAVYERKTEWSRISLLPTLQLGSHQVGMMVIRESFCLHKNPSSVNVHSLTPPPPPSEAHRPVLTLPQSLPVSVLTRPPYCNMGAGRTRPVTSVMSLCTTMPNSFR